MDDFDFDTISAEASRFADETRPAPPPPPEPEPEPVAAQEEAPTGPEVFMEKPDNGTVMNQGYDNEVDYRRFRHDVGMALVQYMKDKFQRQKEIHKLQVKLGFER